MKARMCVTLIVGVVIGWRLCAWHYEHKIAAGVKRILSKLSPAARAEVLDAAAPIVPKGGACD